MEYTIPLTSAHPLAEPENHFPKTRWCRNAAVAVMLNVLCGMVGGMLGTGVCFFSQDLLAHRDLSSPAFLPALSFSDELSFEAREPRLGVLQIDYPDIVLACDDPSTYPYDVTFTRIPGLTVDVVEASIQALPPPVEKDLFEGVDRLIAQGVDAIAGNDGFMIKYQDILRQRTGRVPVVMSSLVCMSLVRRLHTDADPIAIITANGTALESLRPIISSVAGVDPWASTNPFTVIGAEGVPGFSAIRDGTEPDYSLICPGVVDLARSILAERPVAAFILECTELPPCRKELRHALPRIPVYDYMTCTNAVMNAMESGNAGRERPCTE